MKLQYKEKVLSEYLKLFEKFGYNPKSLRWGSRKGKQSLRFEIMCQIGDLQDCSLLDVGCGFGDLYRYLQYRKIRTKYYGVDINPKFIEIGRKIYPKIKLELRDIEENKFKRKFDWVFCSGLSADANSYEFVNRILSEMFRICKRGVAMNFVGGVLDYKNKNLWYSDPEKIYTITRHLSNRLTIRHDYAPYEYTLYLYKNNAKTSNLIFQEFMKNQTLELDDRKWHPYYKKKHLTNLINSI